VLDELDAVEQATARAALLAEVQTLHDIDKLHFEGGVAKTDQLAKTLGGLAKTCHQTASCLVEQGVGAEAAFVLAVKVAPSGPGRVIEVTLIDVKLGSLAAQFARTLPPGVDLSSEVRGTARLALRRFLGAGDGALAVVVSVPGAEVTIDGNPAGTSPLDAQTVGSGPHLVAVEMDGFHSQEEIVEVPLGGSRTLEVVLVPTAERLESQAFGRTLWSALAWTTIGVGALTTLTGGGVIGYAAIEAERVNQAVRDANAEHAATGVPEDVAADLQTQTDQTHLLTIAGASVAAVGLVIAAGGVVLLFMGE
jgi:hypothetical protein